MPSPYRLVLRFVFSWKLVASGRCYTPFAWHLLQVNISVPQGYGVAPLVALLA